MLPPARDYDRLVADFRWQIPREFNIAVAACDAWAAREPERVALFVKAQQGFQEVTYGSLR